MNDVTIARFPNLSYAGAEAINTLCTNLSFSGEGTKKVMLTSCQASEGKSFISMNIMRTLSKLGKKVALVDADIRRSMINSRFGLQYETGSERRGLSHLLAGMASEEDVLYRTNLPGAYMVPVGRELSNPLPLLSSPRFGRLLDWLAGRMDCVLVDAPPVGAVIDAAEIAKSCDGILIVVAYNSVRRKELADAVQQLRQTGCPILGTVLNRVEFDSYMSKKYYYKSHYYGNYEGEEKPGAAQSSAGKGARTRKK